MNELKIYIILHMDNGGRINYYNELLISYLCSRISLFLIYLIH